MSQPITRDDLMSLEQYAEKRGEFRQQVLEHKKHRQVPLGPNATLYFEDRLTLLYQIQEMLRIEKVFEAAGINEELEAYNPLIPNGRNFKATFMIEYPDPLMRAAQLALYHRNCFIRANLNPDLFRTRQPETRRSGKLT